MGPFLLVVLAATAGTAGAAPCFPGERSVRVDERLWSLSGWYDDDGRRAGPKAKWGTCTVDNGVVRERDGTKVASVFCGMVIYTRGISDDKGVTIGMKGEAVLERYGDGPSSTLVCRRYLNPDVRRTRCLIPASRADWDAYVWAYDVRGRMPAGVADEDGFARGEKALAFFRSRRVLQIFNRGACH
ncbi:MAG TPA: hypothetical protein VM261_25765 [Kofleriaceae bacterium]|nr:hypothetical protein [Kofleriaceae bacterium]